METNENENTTAQTLWMQQRQSWEENTLQSRPISRHKKKSQIHNLTAHLKELEAEQQRHPNPAEEGK